MSRSTYDALLSGRGEQTHGLLGALGDAAQLRRDAYALATEEMEAGTWVEEEAPARALQGVALMRMAADDGEDARTCSEHPVGVDGAPGWAVSVESEPTIDGGSLYTLTRIWQGDPPPPPGPAITAVIAGDETDTALHLKLGSHEAARQVAVNRSPKGRLHAMAWAILD